MSGASASAIEDLLTNMGYGPLRRQGINFVGYCQIHGEVPGTSRPSFSVREDNGVYQCFSCGARGVLGKLARQGGYTLPGDLLQQFRQAAEERAEERRLYPTAAKHMGWSSATPLPESFLYSLDATGPGIAELTRAGFPAELLADLGVRWDAVKRRVVYPLRDCAGKLVCLIGRETVGSDRGKYKVYVNEIGEMCRAWAYDFPYRDYRPASRDYLWLMHEEMVPPSDPDTPLLVVEGFKCAMWAILAGVPRGSVCAILGSTPTTSQIVQLERTGRRIILALDNDAAGRQGTSATIDRIGTPVCVFAYSDNRKQLDDIPLEELRPKLAAYMAPPVFEPIDEATLRAEMEFDVRNASMPPALVARRARATP